MDILLGLQWGDEGKGKVVDFLAPQYDIIARFQGGPNAGHTLEFEGRKHVLHQIPSGIFRENLLNVIGNGVVLDPITLKKEMVTIQNYKPDAAQNLFISRKAHVILPTHRLLDAALEKEKGDKKIGSTLKGIGPVYRDKIARTGLRMGDLESSLFEEKYQALRDKHLAELSRFDLAFQLEELEEEFFEAVKFVRKLQFVDSESFLNQALSDGKRILAEGAQGALLDIDFGSYPFVTSSNTSSAGACSGLGISPRRVSGVLGIFKAYCTRVGSGPFPTELHDATGQAIQKIGREFGATTGRPRRCGWLDLPALKYAVMINGVTELFMMKADVLSDFEEIYACTHYRLENGKVTNQFPYDINDQQITPIYQSFKGWKTSLSDVTADNIPTELSNYIQFIEKEIQVPIRMISVGPDRSQTIIR